MIPKTIHFCWLSGDPYPDLITKCIETWHKHLSGYKFVLWDKSRFDIESIPWVKEAYESKKYAFAADYIRLYALYNEGGIYLDCDIEVVKDFAPLLTQSSFLGYEKTGGIEAAIIGAQAGTEWVKQCLQFYEHRHFIDKNRKLSINPIPGVITKTLNANYILPLTSNEITIINKANLTIYPADYFYPKKPSQKGRITITKNTFCIHHFDGSWYENSLWNRIKGFVLKILFFMFNEDMAVKIMNIRRKLNLGR